MGNGTFVYISRIDESGFRLICYNEIEFIFFFNYTTISTIMPTNESCGATLTLLINFFKPHGHRKYPKMIPNNKIEILIQDVLMAFMFRRGGGKSILMDFRVKQWVALELNFSQRKFPKISANLMTWELVTSTHNPPTIYKFYLLSNKFELNH